MKFETFHRYYDRLLEGIAAALMAGVTLIIVAGFVFRWIGYSLVWYDEVGAVGKPSHHAESPLFGMTCSA